MADKVFKLSLEQLNDIVSDAVANAIKKLDGIEIVSDDPKSTDKEVEITEFSEEQYREAMDTMQRNRGAGDEPKVGIFWYIIAVGTWIDNNSEAIELVIEEFDLPKEKTVVQKATHWDIGQTWND